jgi:hypothetical protein
VRLGTFSAFAAKSFSAEIWPRQVSDRQPNLHLKKKVEK